jgi:hypothetical protein
MIEKIVLDYLNEALDVPCYMEYPEEKILPFVVIEKTGSGESNHIKNATFALQSVAESLYAAAELNGDVKAAMDAIIIRPDISASKLNGDYNFTDAATKQYRYQAIYDLYYCNG